jgi:hypothetical protein
MGILSKVFGTPSEITIKTEEHAVLVDFAHTESTGLGPLFCPNGSSRGRWSATALPSHHPGAPPRQTATRRVNSEATPPFTSRSWTLYVRHAAARVGEHVACRRANA